MSIPEKGWTSDHPIIFNLDPKAYEPEGNKYELMTARAIGDTLPRLHGSFKASLSLRYKDDSNARSVSVIMEQASLDRGIQLDTLAFTLFDNHGNSAGQGRFGLNETTITLPNDLIVSEGTIITLYPLPYPQPPSSLLSLTLTLRAL